MRLFLRSLWSMCRPFRYRPISPKRFAARGVYGYLFVLLTSMPWIKNMFPPIEVKEEEKRGESQAAGMEGAPQHVTAGLHNNQVFSEFSSNEAGHYKLSTISSPTQHPPDT